MYYIYCVENWNKYILTSLSGSGEKSWVQSPRTKCLSKLGTSRLNI